jgi:cytochrome c oxidase subunit 1
MALGVIFLLGNIIITIVKDKKVGRDPWEDGRTLEWAIPQPVPFYNFKQTPLVRGLDTYWIEKQEGNKEGMIYAEPIGDIHMPNNSVIPFVMAFGLFVGAFGALYNGEQPWAIPVLGLGLLITFLSMGTRSLKDDLGYHVHKEDLLDDNEGGKH